MREIRYQGAIIRKNHILLIEQIDHEKNESYWTFPGGGIEAGESETDCIIREMKEETGLDVEVISLLFDEPDTPSKTYKRRKTYLCLAEGEPTPGIEPESPRFEIGKIAWFDLCDENSWGETVISDPFVYPVLKNIQAEFGYDLEYPIELEFFAPVMFAVE